MFVLPSISSHLEFCSVNDTSIYENYKLKPFKNIKILGEISNNWPNDLLEKTWILIIIIVTNIACINTSSITCKWGTFLLFSSLIILLLVLPSDFNSSSVKSSRQYSVFILNTILFSILFTYILLEGLSLTASCFFDDILKIILNIWYRIYSLWDWTRVCEGQLFYYFQSS